jgi:hypothetical protein
MNCHQTVQINNQMNDDQTDNNQIQQQQQQVCYRKWSEKRVRVFQKINLEIYT